MHADALALAALAVVAAALLFLGGAAIVFCELWRKSVEHAKALQDELDECRKERDECREQ